jgi:hypothetical protein
MNGRSPGGLRTFLDGLAPRAGSSVRDVIVGLRVTLERLPRWRPVSGISLLASSEVSRLSFPQRTDVVISRSRREFRSILLGARGVPLGNGVRDYLGRGRSHQSKVCITNSFLLNSLPLRQQIVFCVLQLSRQPVDFRNRHGSGFSQ